MVITLLITLLVEVPIDNRIWEWTVESIPADRTGERTVWQDYHAYRPLAAMLSFAAYAWGVLTWPHVARSNA